MSGPTDPDGPLSLADETARLLAALSAGIPEHAPGPPTPGDASDPSAHPSTCTWCPLCRGMDHLRSVDSDAVDRLADAVTLLAKALGDLGAHLRERVVTPGYEPPARAHPQTRESGSRETFDITVTDEDHE